MAEDVHIAVCKRPQQPVGHLLAILRKPGMDGGDDVIQLRKELIRKIERAVTEDVALDAGEKAEVFEFGIQFFDTRDLDAQSPFIQTSRLDRAPAVIGDPEILQSQVLGCRRLKNGNTLVLAAASHNIAAFLYSKLTYDPLKDFVGVANVGNAGYVLAVASGM